MMPNNFGGQNFSVPPPSFGGNQQFKNDNQGNWQPPSTGGKLIYHKVKILSAFNDKKLSYTGISCFSSELRLLNR